MDAHDNTAEKSTERVEIEPLPERPFSTGIVSFLLDGESGLRWLLLCVSSYVVQLLVVYTLHYMSADDLWQIAAVLLSMLLGTVGISFAFLAAACCLTIVQDTANGLKKVENWPDANFTEWALDAFFVINATFMSFMPGAILGQMLVCASLPMETIIVTGVMTMFILFPPILLSCLDYGSSIYPGAPAVWFSFRKHWRSWKRFYWLAMTLGAGCLLAHLLIWTGWMILGTIGSFVIVTLTMIYFRLLGRLSRIIEERDGDEDVKAVKEDEPVDDKANDDKANDDKADEDSPEEDSPETSSPSKTKTRHAPEPSDLDLDEKDWDTKTWSDLR